ncbi:MAG TPA: hypothetical protein VN937_05655 [Blastocatellia bacterium]|nr:hypothetical protein [Blastocatellia bacterium]
MPISEYILLTLLAAGGVALPDGSPTAAAPLGADAIVQPNGGASSSASIGQQTPKKETSRLKRLSKTRHGRKGKTAQHRIKPDAPKKDGGKRSGNL